MDLGNMFFTLGLSTKDFDKKMEDEIKKAKNLREEMQNALKGITLGGDTRSLDALKLQAEANKLNAEAALMRAKAEKVAAGATNESSGAGKRATNVILEETDAYTKLYNKILLINEEQSKLSTNARFGFSTQQVDDAIAKLERFKQMLKDALNSGSLEQVKGALKLYSNQDYAVVEKEVQNLINEGNKYAKQQQEQLSNTAKVKAEEEKRSVTIASLTAQVNKLAQAEEKLKFAQTNGGAKGVLTNNMFGVINSARENLGKAINSVNGGVSNKSDIAVAMEQARLAITDTNSAIQRQKILNQENGAAATRGGNDAVAAQRKIAEAQAQNARLIMSSNGHLSITKRLIGEMGTAASMYFSIFTAQHLLESLIRIRGEFDMQYISLKAILQSGEQATKLFEQIKGLAVISPFKFMDLTTYAKQLSAYQIPTNELFDTTKRLADLSSGIGVGMDRIILAYGQVRSAAFLRGQELRQFTEAGIPMVDELAARFTKLTGKVTNAGDVFDKISKRQVPFQMVKDVIDNLTSEGGKFYNMQEKQAESLKGKVSNLADQYDIMMNRIGQSNDGLLKGGVDVLNSFMQNSDKVLMAVKDLAIMYGVYRVATMAQTTAMGKNLSIMTTEEAKLRVKQASLAREAQLYRELTVAESASLAHHSPTFGSTSYKELSSYELGTLVSNQRISQNEALRLMYLGKIKKETAENLVSQGLITKEQVRRVALAREENVITRTANVLRVTGLGTERATNLAISARIAMMRLGESLMAAFSSIINPTTLIIGGITAAMVAWQDYDQQQQKIRDDAKQLSSDMKEEWTDIQKFIADHPIDIAIKGGKGAITEYINQYADELRKVLPEDLANAQIAGSRFDDNGNQQSIENQLKSMAELVKSAQQAKAIIEDNSDAMSSAAKSTNGWFSQGLITNFEQFVGSVSDYRDKLNNINREQFEKTVSGEGMNPTAKYFRDNAEAAAEATKAIRDNVNAYKLIDIAKRNYKKSDIETPNGKYMQDMFLSDMGIGNGISAASKEMKNNMKDAENDMSDMIEQFKKNLADKNIDWASKQGHDISETFKQKLMEQNGITGTDEQTMFSFMFDEKMYGKTDAAFSVLVQRMKSSADRNIRDAASKFEQDGVWTSVFVNSLNKAKDEAIAKFPFLKQELMRSWNVNQPVFKAMIETYFNAQKLQGWQKELLAITGGEYDVEIKTSSNIDEAIKAIEEKYKAAKQYIHDQKPLMIKIGYKFDGKPVKTGNMKQYNFKTHKWETSSGEAESAIQDEVIQDEKEAKAFKRLLYRKLVTDQKLKGEKSGSKGTKKDEYTEALRRNYDDLKNAIQKYKDLLKSMGSDTAMEVIKKSYGFAISSRYLSDSGLVNLTNDFIRKNIKKTDTAKGFGSTLTQDRTAANVELAKLSPDARAKAILDSFQISKEQYRVYDEMFSKLGSSSMASTIAFGKNTKPYENIVEEMRSKFFELAKVTKLDSSMTLEKLLGLTPENLSKQPDKVQEFVGKYKEEFNNMLSPIRKQMIDALTKSDDVDIKLAVNENVKNLILSNLRNIMKGASDEEIKKAEDDITKAYAEDATKIKLDEIKKSLNWEDLFSDLGSLSFTQLDMLNTQLEKIVSTTKDLKDRPEIMKEWVSKLNNVRDAMSKLEPYKNMFEAFKGVRDARNARDAFADKVKALPQTEQYNAALESEDTKSMEAIKNIATTITDINGKSMTYGEVLDALTKSSKAYHDAQKKAAETDPSRWIVRLFTGKGKLQEGIEDLTNFGKIVDTISTNAQSMDEFRKKVGIGDNTIVGRATSGLAGLSSGVSSAVKSALSGDVFGVLNGIYGGFEKVGESIFGGGANYDDLNAQLERSRNVVQYWTDELEKSTKHLKESSTEDRKTYAEKARNALNAELLQYRTDLSNVFGSGASAGSSSIAGRYNKGQYGDWSGAYSKINSKLGTNISSIQDLIGLTPEQLEWIKENFADLWVNHDENVKNALENIIALKDKYKELDDTIKETWTSTSINDITSGYSSLLSKIDDMTVGAGNNITSIIRNALINSFMQSDAIQKAIKNWRDKLYEYMTNEETGTNGSALSESEIAKLKEQANSDITNPVKLMQETLKQSGLYSDLNSSSASSSVKGTTEETSDLLVSYVNAIRADVALIRAVRVSMVDNEVGNNTDVISAISEATQRIEANTRIIANNSDWMKEWAGSITKMTSNGKSIRT